MLDTLFAHAHKGHPEVKISIPVVSVKLLQRFNYPKRHARSIAGTKKKIIIKNKKQGFKKKMRWQRKECSL